MWANEIALTFTARERTAKERLQNSIVLHLMEKLLPGHDTNTKQDEDEIVDSNSHPLSRLPANKEKCWEELSHREKELLNYSYGTRSLVPLERLESLYQ